MVEVNISCPNVEDRGQVFACDPRAAAEVVAAVRRNTAPEVPVFAKLSPDVTDITAIARSCVDAGATGLSVINTLLGMAIDTTTLRPVLGGITGGLSGPAIRPVAVRCVWQVHQALPDVPVLGMGGIRTGLDALEFVLAGASAVSVGTTVFGDPTAPLRVLAELEQALDERGFDRFADAVGLAHQPFRASCPRAPTPSATSSPGWRRDARPVAVALARRTRGGVVTSAPVPAPSRSRWTPLRPLRRPVPGWTRGWRRDAGPVAAPIAVALDAPDAATAAAWAAAAAPHVQVLKVGLELFVSAGPGVVEQVRSGRDVFLDLKLHDIPNTVAGAARAVAGLRPRFLTVHAAGGAAMVRAAVEAAPEVTITAVTVLTSLTDDDLAAVGLAGPALDAARRLAALAVAAGAGAVVCSPREVAAVRAEVGPGVVLITPGVRPAGSAAGDQARVATPQQALADGADLLVVGRPITGAADVGEAARALAASLA